MEDGEIPPFIEESEYIPLDVERTVVLGGEKVTTPGVMSSAAEGFPYTPGVFTPDKDPQVFLAVTRWTPMMGGSFQQAERLHHAPPRGPLRQLAKVQPQVCLGALFA